MIRKKIVPNGMKTKNCKNPTREHRENFMTSSVIIFDYNNTSSSNTGKKR
jgi:hypothetical protein